MSWLIKKEKEMKRKDKKCFEVFVYCCISYLELIVDLVHGVDAVQALSWIGGLVGKAKRASNLLFGWLLPLGINLGGDEWNFA